MKSNIGTGTIFDVGSLFERFEKLSDSRSTQGLRYPLAVILVLMVMAKMSGEDQPSGIAEWAKYRADEIIEMLKLRRKTMPHHSTYRRIMADVINAEELELMVSDFLTGKKYFGKQVMVSIDGKVLRGTLNEAQEGVYLLAAYLPTEGLVLMEVTVEGKGKEIPAALKLLKKLDLREKIVMGDALHTQRATSAHIGGAGGDYIWYAKGNQSQMEEDIRLWFDPEPKPLPGQGRIEIRKITVSSQLRDFCDWPYLEQVFMLEHKVTDIKRRTVRERVIYGFTSLSREQATPAELLALIRSYWGIENGLHYRRDVTLLEDKTRMINRNAGQVMACINNLVLGILIGQKKFRYLPTARRYFNANLSKAFSLISGL